MIIDGKHVKKTSLEAKGVARQMRFHRKLTFWHNYERNHRQFYMPPRIKWNKYRPHQGEQEKARRAARLFSPLP